MIVILKNKIKYLIFGLKIFSILILLNNLKMEFTHLKKKPTLSEYLETPD